MEITRVNLKQTIDNLNMYLDGETINQDLFRNILRKNLTEEIITHEFIIHLINVINVIEKGVQEENKMSERVLSSFLNALDPLTGERLFTYKFTHGKENGLTIINLDYKPKNDKEDHFKFIVEEIVKYFSDMINKKQVLEDIIADFDNLMIEKIHEMLTFSDALYDDLINDKMSIEHFEKRIFMKFNGAKSFALWKEENEDN